MIIQFSESDFINTDHIVRLIRIDNQLQVTYSTGETELIYDAVKINKLIKSLKYAGRSTGRKV